MPVMVVMGAAEASKCKSQVICSARDMGDPHFPCQCHCQPAEYYSMVDAMDIDTTSWVAFVVLLCINITINKGGGVCSTPMSVTLRPRPQAAQR
jgi:hypothetical protein